MYGRKVCAFILCVFVLCLTYIPAVFADTALITAESVSANPEDTVNFQIVLESNPGIGTMLLNIEFDKTRLRIANADSISFGDALPLLRFRPNPRGHEVNPFVVLWNSRTTDTSTGVLLNIEFTVLPTARAGAAFVNVSVNNDDDIVCENEIPVNFSIVQGNVNVLRDGIAVDTAPPPNVLPPNEQTPLNGEEPADGYAPLPDGPAIQPIRTLPFLDVPDGAWFFEYVRTVWEGELFQGTSESLFSPQSDMTRAMFVTVLWRKAGSPLVELIENSFADVRLDAWYSTAVVWAAENGIVGGVGDNYFAPNSPVNREQIAAILYRYQQFSGEIPTDIVMGRQFADWDYISDWAKGPVNVLTIQDILQGRPGGNFDPRATATRAEVSAVFTRFINALNRG